MTGEPLQSGVDHYLASLRNERRLSPHTSSNYGRDLAALLDYCASQGIDNWQQLDPQHLRMFAAREHRRGLAPRSIQRRLSACRGLFRYLLREGELKRDPTGDVQAPKARKRLPTPLDADTMARLLEFRGDDSLGVRDKAIMELLYSSGLRLSELLGLDLLDLDLRDRTVRVVGKGNKTRIVPVGRQAIAALQRWIAARTTIAAVGEQRRVRRRQWRPPRSADRAAPHRPLGPAAGIARARASPHVPALVRFPPARIVAGPARRAGIARAREHQHDPGLHSP